MKSITKIKTKYYSKEILKYLFLTGAILIAGSSPYFISNLMKSVFKNIKSKRKKIDAFNYLKKRKLIEIKRNGHDVSVALTAEGKKRAGKYQINDLTIEKLKKWDKKWRVVIFDVPNPLRTVRDILRRKLKEFGFYPLQQSIWIFPYPCDKEIKFLREFFGLNRRQVQVLEVSKLENDHFFKKIFNL